MLLFPIKSLLLLSIALFLLITFLTIVIAKISALSEKGINLPFPYCYQEKATAMDRVCSKEAMTLCQKRVAKRFRATTITISKFELKIFLGTLDFSLLWLHLDLIKDKYHIQRAIWKEMKIY